MNKNFGCMILLSMIFILAVSGCNQAGGGMPKPDAIALLKPTAGSNVEGTVSFIKVENGVRVMANISNLSPGEHGFHVHTYGDCSAPDAESAGGHFNPHDKPHGAPGDEQRHVGDLGNIVADQNGVAVADFVDPLIALEGENAIIGRAVVVHAQPDDLKSQPSGAAGDRLACGVVGYSQK
jgi:Cu-Zn family superoxide dismutase